MKNSIFSGFGPISFPPKPLVVAASQLAGFQCDPSNDFTPPYTVEWFKDNATIASLNNSRILVVEETGSLFIREVQSSDAGSYTCVVENDAGLAQSSTTLTVTSEALLG